MNRHLRRIDVDGLCIGMYVSQLDRPWLETPFLFQGFFIRNTHEIDELRRYCEYVEIDIEESDPRLRGSLRSESTAKPEKASSQQGAKRGFWLWEWIRKLFGRSRPIVSADAKPGEFYQDTVSTADELVVARSVHSGALEKLMSVLNDIRTGGSLPMPDVQIVADAMVESVLRNSTAMALLVRMQQKDEYTTSHSLKTSVWALVFGRHLGLDRESLRAVGLGALLLDVGKTKMPVELLNKTGEITDVERAYLHTHVDRSLEILREAGGIDNRVLEMVATHHERYDGSGYPKGWRGNQIPVFGRIAGIVDSYAAMTSDRPYAAAMSSYDAMREFKSLSDKHFQAEMVEQFIQAIGIFPAGTLVELNTGEIGVVLKEHQSSRLQPDVAIILDSNKQPLEQFETIDLHAQDGPTPTIWIERGVEPGAYDIDPKDFFI